MRGKRISRRGLRTAAVVALLAFTAGSLDGSLFTLYDIAFASIMTGNMILFGVAFATFNMAQVMILGISLVSYCVGVYLGALLIQKDYELFYMRRWPSRVVLCLFGSFMVLCVAITVTLFTGDSTALLAVKFGLLACAMGMMASSVRKVGYTISVTYLTGALTAFWERIAKRNPPGEFGAVSAVSVASLIAGALTGGIISNQIGSGALVIPGISMLAALILILATQAGEKARLHS